jgi:EAL domain-containing protein (putative c-di-GMP-specific phosphodiesterase class I)
MFFMTGQQVQRYKANEMIFHEADAADCAFLIELGKVRVFLENDGEEIELRILGEGEVFGEMALIDNSVRSASCRALTDCQLIVVTKVQLLERVQSADPVVRLLMRVLFERLRSHNDLLRGKPAIALHKADPLDLEKRAALERIGLENRILAGLDQEEFLPYYQPIYDLATGEIKGCEALLRWISKEHGVVPPSVFMDIMEDSSLILRAGETMIAACMRDLALMRATFPTSKDFFISINVSGRQFADPGFLGVLEKCRALSQVNSNHIKLELTERVMMEGPHALLNLKKCRDLGYQIAVDDFGTGFSSLQYLAQMPLTDLKIDRSFVVGILDDSKSLSIIKSLIYMADLLGLRLIAEGIESPAQRDLLRQLKVEMGQGWLFAKALPRDEFTKLAATIEFK